MNIPSKERAMYYLREGEKFNPGVWVNHSIYAAKAAYNIAKYHKDLDEDRAYIYGLLHDIGRREGFTYLHHIISGYNFMKFEGYSDVARICMTHSFVIQDINSFSSKWDCNEAELEFIKNYIDNIEYNDYDLLIQLCDTLALPSGFCIVEKRLVDIISRHGTNKYTSKKCIETLNLKKYFDDKIGRSIYELLEGIVKNTLS